MPTEVLQDTIELSHTIEHVVSSHTVKVTAEINAVIVNFGTSGSSDEDIKTEILKSLTSIISPGAWIFSNMRRYEDASGVEQLAVSANVRVHESMNAGLAEKARAASRAGLKITISDVDDAIPRLDIVKAEGDMRQTILEYANIEVERYRKHISVFGSDFRIHRISFGRAGRVDEASNSFAKAAISATSYSLESASGGASGGAGSFGNSQKFTMTASIVIARLITPIDPAIYRL